MDDDVPMNWEEAEWLPHPSLPRKLWNSIRLVYEQPENKT